MSGIDWLTWRRGGFGASDAASVATGSYGGLFAVVADKLGLEGGKEIDQDLADRGHRWERPIADAVRALTGYYVHGEQLLVEAADDKRHRCTLDGLLDPRPEIAGIDDAEALLEIKTKGLNVKANWAYYRTQPQWQMHVTGKQRAVLVVATIDDTTDTCTGMHLEVIERDDYLIGHLIDIADHALLCVEAGELPDPDAATDLELVREINGLIHPDRQDGPPIDELDDDLGRWLALKAAAKDITGELNGIEGRIRHHMGDSLKATSTRYRLKVGEPIWKFTKDSEAAALATHPEHSKTVLDRTAFKEAEPGLYDELKRPTTDRRITVKEIE